MNQLVRSNSSDTPASLGFGLFGTTPAIRPMLLPPARCSLSRNGTEAAVILMLSSGERVRTTW